MTNQLKEEFGVPGVETNLSLSTMHGRKVISVSRIACLTVERPYRRATVDLPKAYTRDKIPSRLAHGQWMEKIFVKASPSGAPARIHCDEDCDDL